MTRSDESLHGNLVGTQAAMNDSAQGEKSALQR
jgi:hypothetical protein